MNSVMQIAKVRKVKTPERGTSKSAGIDFFVPEDFSGQMLEPHEDALIPSGISALIPDGYMLMAANKSGVCPSREAKIDCETPMKITGQDTTISSCVIIGASIIDEDYPGEIHIHIVNVGKNSVWIERGQKIAQFILVPVSYADICEASPEVVKAAVLAKKSERKGGFNSTSEEQ